MDRQDAAEIYEKHFNYGFGRLFRIAATRVEERAQGVCVYDADGRRYIDFSTSFGVFCLGHGDPDVKMAVMEATKTMAAKPYGMASEPEAALRRLLCEVLPGDLEEAVFCGSGSEAAEIALRLVARARPDRRKIVCVDKGYHGKTLGAMSILGQSHLRAPFNPLWDDVVHVDCGDVDAVIAAIDDDTAAVFVEPVIAGNYLVIPPLGYLSAIREACHKTNALMVVDEVQTAFGRTGELFGVDRDGVTPDIMMISKALTGGMAAFACTVYRDAIFDYYLVSDDIDVSDLSSDFAGWPVSCAAALATAQKIMDECLHKRVKILGGALIKGLRALARRYPEIILDAQGLGLMTGITVKNRAIEYYLFTEMKRRGFLIGLSLNSSVDHPVIRFYPPFMITIDDIEQMLSALESSLKTVSMIPSFLMDMGHRQANNMVHLPKPIANGIGAFLGRDYHPAG